MHVAIIGAYGSAGVAVADALADEDVRLTLVDDGDPGGGLCILRGCMPSKDVLSATDHRSRVRRDDRLEGAPDVDLDRVVAAKDEHVATFAEHRRSAVGSLAERDGVEFRREAARFVDDRTLRVGDRELAPDYTVVATGSVPNVPDLPGLESVPYHTSADVLDATALPDSGIVMGFGYVGLELVPYLAELGVDLTVVEHDARPLDEADPAFGDAVLELYREAYGVEVLTRTRERSVEPTDDGGVRLTVEPDGAGDADDSIEGEPPEAADGADGAGGGVDTARAIEADALYLFTGRRPNLDGLGLDRAGIDPGDGWVEPTMQASDHERVFVVGDANGREPILHVAKEEGQVAAANLRRHARGEPLRSHETLHHHVVFAGLSGYPFARVGHSRASARAAGLDHRCVTREARDDGVFLVKDAPEGLARLVVGDDGTVLGYQGLHRHADVMAKTMQVVVELGLDVRSLPHRAYHPTTPEILDGLFRDATDALAVDGPADR